MMNTNPNSASSLPYPAHNAAAPVPAAASAVASAGAPGPAPAFAHASPVGPSQPASGGGLVTRGLTKHYTREGFTVPALSNVDLVIPTGSQVAIMGPSGCGKTTLLHTLAGIVRPTSGSILVEGQEIVGMPEAALSSLRLQRFGFVFQDGQLLPELTNEENVAMPLLLAGVSRREALDRARAHLAALGLDGHGAYLPGQLSGGQAQRVAIARALVTRPAVVFADEPTGALDQATGADVMRVLTEATAASGATLLLVTHDQGVAHWLQHTIRMQDGRIQSLSANGTQAASAAQGV